MTYILPCGCKWNVWRNTYTDKLVGARSKACGSANFCLVKSEFDPNYKRMFGLVEA